MLEAQTVDDCDFDSVRCLGVLHALCVASAVRLEQNYVSGTATGAVCNAPTVPYCCEVHH